MYTRICIYLYYIFMYINIYIHIYIHIYTHTHKHTHTYTHIPNNSKFAEAFLKVIVSSGTN